VIDESMDFYGIKSGQAALELVALARWRAALSEEESLDLALR